MSDKAEILQKKKKSQKKKKYILLACIAIGVCILGVFFFRIRYFRTTTVQVSGIETIDTIDVMHRVDNMLSGSYLWVFPKNNIFLIHKRTLIHELTSAYSRIDTVKIHKHMKSIDIEITERKPTSIWCQHITDTACYFVHTDGTIFDTAGIFSNPLYFMYTTPISDTAPIGQVVLSHDKLNRVNQIVSVARDYGVEMYGYTLVDTYEENFYITPITSGLPSAYVKTRNDQSAETIVSNLVTALKTDVLKNEKDHAFSHTDYIDLRFDGKVIYKIKEN